MSHQQQQQVEPSGKTRYPALSMFKLGKAIEEPVRTPHWVTQPASTREQSRTSMQQVAILAQECRENRMLPGAVVTNRTNMTGSMWRMSSHFYWGIVTNLKQYDVFDDKMVQVRWFVPNNHGNMEMETLSPHDLVIIYQAYEDKELTAMIDTQLMQK